MFKRGVITDEISQDFKVAVGLAKKYKLDGVEIRSVWEKGPHELSDADIAEIKAIADGSGMEVCAVSSPFFKCNIDSELEYEEHIEILKRSIHLAKSLGTNIVRGFTFWNRGNFDIEFNRILSKFELPIRILERENIVLGLESEENVFTTNASRTRRVIEGLGSKHVRGLWDPGNDVFSSEREIPYPDGYEIIKPYMVHMHLKDAMRMPDGKVKPVPIGEGDVDYKSHFRRIVSDNYEGYVVLETHYRPKSDLSENLLALPKGSAFSYLGYEATEECLIKWENLLKQSGISI